MDLTYSPERYSDYFCWTSPWKIFPSKTLDVTLLQKWVRLCVLWQAGVHQAIFWSWCWDDVVSGPTRPRGRSYSGKTSYPGPYLGPNLSVARTMARTRRHLEIFLNCHAAERCVTTQIMIAETGKGHEPIFCITDKMFLLLFEYWLTVRLFYLCRFAGMQCLQNGSQDPKMVPFVFGYEIVVLIWNNSHYTIGAIRLKELWNATRLIIVSSIYPDVPLRYCNVSTIEKNSSFRHQNME